MVIGGWTAVTDTHGPRVGSLLVGAHDDRGQLIYSGAVQSGLTHRARAALAGQLARIPSATPPFTNTPVRAAGRVKWVRPQIVVEVEYREFTGRLRHPSLKSLSAIDPATVMLPLS